MSLNFNSFTNFRLLQVTHKRNIPDVIHQLGFTAMYIYKL